MSFSVRLRGGAHKRVQSGYPWVFSNEIDMDAAAKSILPGTLVRLARADGHALGWGHFNPHSLIAFRLLERDTATCPDGNWLLARLRRALDLREALYPQPFYRLCHAEADGLPGLVIDRFDDVLTVQTNNAGMSGWLEDITAALQTLLAPRAIILRNDSPIRHLEGLEDDVRLLAGANPGPVTLIENDCRFQVDLLDGQKTGWFYDHRENRAFIARLAKGRSVLDLYCYAGAFTMPAARAGARTVTALDRSAPALALAAQSAILNDVADKCRFEKADVFGWLEREQKQ